MSDAEDREFWLRQRLDEFRTWFDPTAKGDRIRSLLSKLPATQVDVPWPEAADTLIIDAGQERHLVTPEGFLVLWCLRQLEQRSPSVDEDALWTIDEQDAASAREALLATYRGWTRRRLEDVIGLLTSETSTLRPAAAGLLLTLLINRNTDPIRALRRPRETRELAVVSAAVAAPALAYANTLSGRRTSPTSVDLYRGWALGELRRRLGPGFHSELESGIWLDHEAAEEGLRRLVDDVRRRDRATKDRVPAALSSALKAYDGQRPQLAALGLAFERPADTRRIREALEAAALNGATSP